MHEFNTVLYVHGNEEIKFLYDKVWAHTVQKTMFEHTCLSSLLHKIQIALLNSIYLERILKHFYMAAKSSKTEDY